MLQELVIAGFGGQGIMSMGQLITYAGMFEGMHVAYIPSYGPEMRGGTANCSVTLSDREISSPLFTDPSSVIIMNQPSLRRFASAVKPGGIIIVNRSLVSGRVERSDLQVVEIDANAYAAELGNSRVANIVILGAYIGLTKIVSIDSVVESLKKVISERSHHLIPLNRRALEMGVDIVEKSIVRKY